MTEDTTRIAVLEKLLAETNLQLSQREEELAVIKSVQEALVNEMTIEGIYELVGEKIREIFNAQVIDIVTYDAKRNLIEDRYAFEKGDRTLIGPREPKGFRKHVIQTSQLLLHNHNVEQAMLDFDNAVLIGEIPKSQVFIPMIAAGEVKGIISLQNLDREHAFSDSDLNLITTLANSMSVALESARLFDTTNQLLKETEQRTAELSVINSVQDGLAKELNIQGIYELVGEKIREIFNAQVIDIVTYDRNTNLLEDWYAYEKGDRTLVGSWKASGFRKHVIDTGKLLLINEDSINKSIEFNNPVISGEPPKSAVWVPLISGNEVKGMISLQNLDKEHAFSEANVNLLTTLANSMSVALENARLFDETNRLLKETEQRNAELAVINSVQESLVAQMDIKSIYELVGEKIREIFNAQVIDIVTYDKNKNLIEDQYSFEKGDRTLVGPREPKGFRKHVIQSSQLLLHNQNVEQATRDYDNAVVIGEMPKSQVFVPMIAGGEVKGIISLQNLDREQAFSSSDISLLTTLANSMSVALESARLFDETTRLLKETEQRTAELSVINSVQEGLAKELDIQGIYQLVGEKVREIFNAQVIDIVTYNPKLNLIEDRYANEKGDTTLLGPREPNGIRKHLIQTGQLMVINKDYEKISQQYDNVVLIGEQPKSAVFVPMVSGGKVNGMISLQNLDREYAFSEADANLLNTLANSMTVALENARLFDETNRLLKETEQRTAELSVINSVQEGLAKELDIQGIYELVGEKIREIFNAQVFDIVTYDAKTNLIEDRYAYEKGDTTLLGKRVPTGVRKHLIETGHTIVINHDFEIITQQYDTSIINGEQPKSVVIVPLISGGKVNGMISLQNLDIEYAFSDSDINLINTLANSMSVALESARLFDETNRLLKETEQRTAELSVINSVQDGLAKELDIQGIYELVGEKIREIFNAQVIDIVTYDTLSNLIEDRYSFEKGDTTLLGPREPKGVRKKIIETGQQFVINHDFDQISLQYGDTILIGERPKSAVLVPLISGGKVTGMISLQNLDHEYAFSDSDINLINTLANSMSVALESARLFDETNRLLKETEQRTAELSVINSVQDGLAKELDIQGIYELVGEKIREIFNAQVIDIVTYDPSSNLIEDRYSYEKGDTTLLGPREPKGFRKNIIETGHLLVINHDYEKLSRQYNNSILIGEQPKSAVFVPMISGGKVNGMISLQNLDHENAFSDSDINLITTLANSMSVALESARLFDETNRLLKETEQRTAELSVINSVQDGLARELEIQGIYELVGEKMREIFNAQVIDIVTYDPKLNLIEDRYAFEKGDTRLLGPRLPKGFRKHVIESAKTLVINKNIDQERSKYDQSILVGEGSKSLVLVPMIAGGEVTGVISLQNLDQENAFSESDVNLLTTLSNSMSVALESARLFDETTRLLKETEQRTAELAVINSVQEGLAKELDIQGIYELVGEKIRDIFNAQVFDIVTYDKATNLIEDRYTFEKGDRTLLGPRPLQGFRKYTVETGLPLVINQDIETRMKELGNIVLIGDASKSVVFVPMVAGGEVTGVVSVQNIDEENAFSKSDVRLLTTLANSMSVALENARLFDETNRLLKETEQRTAELAVINSVQEGLAKELDMQGIYNLVGDRVQKLFNAQIALIATFDLENKTESFNYFFENGEKVKAESRPINKLRQLLIDKKRSIYISTEEQAKNEYGLTAIEGTKMTKSLLFVPLLTGSIIRGYVSLQHIDLENAFSESDIRLLETLANSMSVALENARLFDETNRLLKETEQRTAELAIINSVQEGLASKLDIKAIYELVGDKIRDVFDTQGISISFYDRSRNFITHPYYLFKGKRIEELGFELGKGLTSHIIQTGQPLLINDRAKERFKELGAVFAASENEEDTAKSWLGVPLISGGMVNGTIRLENYNREFAYNESDVSLLQTLANSMSVALENALLFDETNRLLNETEQRTAELAVINSIQDGLAKELDINGIYDFVGDRICELFDTQSVFIRSFDPQAGLEHWQYAVEKGERLYSEPRPFIWANKLLMKSKQHLLINENYVETAKRHGGIGVSKGLPPKSAVFVPMITGDVVKGSVSLQNVDKENAFTESDLRLLTTITNSMSVALENARLFNETTHLLAESKQTATELSTVNSISKAIASKLDPDDLIKLIGDQLKNLFNANIVYLALLNQKTNTIHFPYQFGDDMAPMKLGEGLTSKIIITGEPLLINKDVDELTAQLGIQRIGISSASYLGVPIPVGEKILGVLSVQSTEHENRFNENDLRFLSTIAASVGVALRNATLFEDVKLAKMEAEAASKLAEKANEAKSAFLSTVSHELRTPLTSVLGFAKIIQKRLKEKIFPIVDQSDPKTGKTINQISENLQVVISEGERLTHLINDVLDLAKIEAGKMEFARENVSMPEVVERAIAATTSLFDQKSLKLITKIDTDLPDITGDKDKLIQVVINLISNSVKFTDKGSITCKVYQEAAELIVSIRDTGIGIAPGDFGAVFEQFKQVGGDTLTDKPKGTGLGLPICKEIVEHLGGRIWLESEQGKGSTFSFALPLQNTKPIVPSRPIHLDDLVKQLKQQVAHSKLNLIGQASHILIVDDDESIRSLLHQELGDAGYQIDQASNGKEALERVKANRPDLIILDIMMPEMNGFDVAAILKNDPHTMDIPIIVLSVLQDKARGFRIGIDRYLTKPIDTSLLFTEIGSLLEHGKSKKKVMVVDEDAGAIKSLTEVLTAKGYELMESTEKELVENAKANQPDIIIINSALSGKQDIVQTLRFEKGLENVVFLVYQ